MTLLALLLVGALAAAGSAWALARGGASARAGAVTGVAGLALVGILAVLSPTPSAAAADASGVAPGMLWNGALAAGGYLRLVVVLGSTTSVLMCALTWLLRGMPGLRALLPASLAALVGTTVALGATNPQLAIVAAGATGLASVPVVLARPGAAAAGVAAREVRASVATALVALAVAAVIPAMARLVLADPASAVATGSGAAAVAALGLLSLALVVGARVGAIPYHVRISALADTAPDGSLPLVLAWLPLPLAAVSVGVAASALAPLALPVGSAQALIVAVALLVTAAAGLVAALQDDLRHAVGYLTLADLGLVVLAFAALDPVSWGPARTWLLTVALTKTALLAWAAVSEDRYETRSVPDLRGWLRPSPMLGVALVLIVVATYGLPGWTVLTARLDLTRSAAGSPWDLLLLAGSLLTVPAYVRWLWLGVGAPTSHVDRAAPEYLARRAASGTARRLALRPPALPRRRGDGLVVEQEGATPASSATDRRGQTQARPAASRALLPVRTRRGRPALAGTSEERGRSIEPEVRDDGNEIGEPTPAKAKAAAAAAEPAGTSGLRTPQELAASPVPAGAVPEPAGASPEPTAPRVATVSAKPRRSRKSAAATTLSVAPANGANLDSTAEGPVGASLWGAPATVIDPELELPGPEAMLAAAEVAPLSDAEPAATPDVASVRAGTGMGRRSRTRGGPSGSSPMTSPRAPEASKALPSDVLTAGDQPVEAVTLARARRRSASGGPGAPARMADAARRHRADLLSVIVLALALLATLVAYGAGDISRAACEPIPAVPSINCG